MLLFKSYCLVDLSYCFIYSLFKAFIYKKGNDCVEDNLVHDMLAILDDFALVF